MKVPQRFAICLLLACASEPETGFRPTMSIRDACSNVARASCFNDEQCDALPGSRSDCVIAETFECCTDFENCDQEIPVNRETLAACEASARSAECTSDPIDSAACRALVVELNNPPLSPPDPEDWNQAFCSDAFIRQIPLCGDSPNPCLSVENGTDFAECEPQVRAYGACFVEELDTCGSCEPELDNFNACIERVCNCEGSECRTSDPRCPEAPKRLFVTAGLSADGFDASLSGADRYCQNEADTAGIGGEWNAFFASAALPLEERFRSVVSYSTLAGVEAAEIGDNFPEFRFFRNASILFDVSGNPIDPILLPALGGREFVPVWTGHLGDCRNWSSSSSRDNATVVDVRDSSPLTSAFNFECDNVLGASSFHRAHLLCLER